MLLRIIGKFSEYGLMAVLVLLIFGMTPHVKGVAVAAQVESDNDRYIDMLIRKADDLKLYNDLYWHTFLHYKKGLTGNFTSLVDDPNFFFAKDGKYNPGSEMRETIRAFFKHPDNNKIHPSAKFIARFNWLKHKLEIDSLRLPYDGEEQFSKFYKEINPSNVIVVFPSGYMNSPASMYGHTLLVIESRDGNRLTAKTANYAAITNETFGPVFALKGLFGMYRGYYSFLPYYQKINEYSYGELRDMWEYELSLSPEEMERMMRHIIEMEDIYSDYYFIDENCSFNLLFLIEAARPETKLTDSFNLGVEPVDTIRVLMDRKLVKTKIYRPSLYSRIQHLRSKLTDSEQKLVRSICNGDKDISEIDLIDVSEEKKTVMSDLVSDYLKFLASRQSITQQEYRERLVSNLQRRSGYMKNDNYIDIPVPPSPEESHRSGRIGIENGHSLSGYFTAISLRASCHDLMDPDEGYNRNSQILFGNISARYYYEKHDVRLQRLDIIDLISLPVSDSFYFTPCYGFKTGLIINTWDNKKEYLSYTLQGLTGLSTLIINGAQVYFLAGMKAYFAGEFDKDSDLQFGGETGVITTAGVWKNRVYTSLFNAPFFEKHTVITAGISESISIHKTVTIMFDYSYNKNFSYAYQEYCFKFNLYF